MRKWIIGAGVTVVALVLGVGAAYGGSQLVKTYRPQIRQAVQNLRGNLPSGNNELPEKEQVPGINNFPGMMGGGATGPLQGMRNRMQGLRNQAQDQRNRNSGTRITLDQAVQAAQNYAAGLGSNFQLAQVLEFQNGFTAVITEKDTGRGAVEVLIDPYNGVARPEMGPALMWNLKYGRGQDSSAQTADNTVTIDQARQTAQTYLDKVHPGAKVNEGGYSFYGYYGFAYSVDGKTAGLLSVNGTTQQIWEPAGLGAFVVEKEMTQ